MTRFLLTAVCALAVLGGLWLVQPTDSPPRADPAPTPEPSEVEATEVLERLRVFGDSDDIGALRDVAVRGTYVVGLDSRPLGDGALLVFSRRDGELTATFGRQGQGPGELMAPVTLGVDITDSSAVWVWDIGNTRFSRFDLDSGDVTRALRLSSDVVEARWIDENRLVANGMFLGETLRLLAVDEAGEARPIATAGPPVHKVDQPEVGIFLQRNSINLSPDRSRTAQAFLYSSRLRFYDASLSLLRSVAGPVEVVLRYETSDGPQAFRHTDDSRWVYLDIATTNEHVYALFSGRSQGASPDTMHLGDKVHVFTWDGVLSSILGLPDPVRSIAVDGEAQRMYGTREEPFPAIVEYSVPTERNGK